jgi:hypothetical protein
VSALRLYAALLVSVVCDSLLLLLLLLLLFFFELAPARLLAASCVHHS